MLKRMRLLLSWILFIISFIMIGLAIPYHVISIKNAIPLEPDTKELLWKLFDVTACLAAFFSGLMLMNIKVLRMPGGTLAIQNFIIALLLGASILGLPLQQRIIHPELFLGFIDGFTVAVLILSGVLLYKHEG